MKTKLIVFSTKLAVFTLLALLTYYDWGGSKKNHARPTLVSTATAIGTPGVTSEPTTPMWTMQPSQGQAPAGRPTPFPTPTVNPASYLPADRPGPAITVSLQADSLARGGVDTKKLAGARQQAIRSQDLGSLINAANAELVRLGGGTLRIEGGGSIKTQVTLNYNTSFDGGTYSCDTQVTDYGCILLGNGVHVRGTWSPPRALLDYFKFGNGRNPRDSYLLAVQSLRGWGEGTTILEPTFVQGPNPSVIVFQALGDSCCSHMEKSHDIAVTGFHIKGRQQTYDGGVRSTIQFGNCQHCMAQNNYLEDTASLGITFGGVALEKGNYSTDGLAYHNVASGVAGANIAAVNSENLHVFENYSFRPGHHAPLFGGGVCGFDLETNTPADHSKAIFVFNNLYDFENAHRQSGGNGICLQDPYSGVNHGLVVAANNIIIGGREDVNFRYMSNGIFLNGLRGCQIINNYIFRTGQNAIQAYGLDSCLIQDNYLESTGGGGNPSIQLNKVVNSIFKRNVYRDRPVAISTDSSWLDVCGKNNQFDLNVGKKCP